MTQVSLLALVPDYKMNLIAPAALGDREFEKFQTTLREALSISETDREMLLRQLRNCKEII